ncbi:MAG TPA: hypothetical protein VMS56_04280, partial [Thermoanaerobaculia bacterium]|nr:hypothetical protein [Thermoanaerobaculia bacterium]
MNFWPLFGATLILLLGALHSWLGERYILIRLFRRPDLPRLFGSDVFTRRTLRFAWHLTSVAWWGLGGLLLLMAGGGEDLGRGEVGAVLAGTAGASAIVTLVGSRGRHPAWIVFVLVA